MIDKIFKVVLDLSISSSFLILIVLLLRPLAKARFTPRFRVLLWIVVMIKLILPISISTNFSVYNYFPDKLRVNDIIQNTNYQNISDYDNSFNKKHSEDEFLGINYPDIKDENAIKDTSIKDTSIKDTGIKDENTNKDTDIGAFVDKVGIIEDKDEKINWNREYSKSVNTKDILKILSVIWLIGFIILVSIYFIINLIFYIRIKGVPCGNSTVLRKYTGMWSEKLGLRFQPDVKETGIINGPAVYGFFKPVLLFPRGMEKNINEEDINGIVLHELSHIKRKDTILGIVSIFIRTLHWFNPLVWYGFSIMKDDMEASCDSMALSQLDIGNHKQYGITLLKLSAKSRSWVSLYGMAGILESKKKIRERIKEISLFKRKGYTITLSAIVILVVISAIFLTQGMEKGKLPGRKDTIKVNVELTGDYNESFELVDSNNIDEIFNVCNNLENLNRLDQKNFNSNVVVTFYDKKGKTITRSYKEMREEDNSLTNILNSPEVKKQTMEIFKITPMDISSITISSSVKDYTISVIDKELINTVYENIKLHYENTNFYEAHDLSPLATVNFRNSSYKNIANGVILKGEKQWNEIFSKYPKFRDLNIKAKEVESIILADGATGNKVVVKSPGDIESILDSYKLGYTEEDIAISAQIKILNEDTTRLLGYYKKDEVPEFVKNILSGYKVQYDSLPVEHDIKHDAMKNWVNSYISSLEQMDQAVYKELQKNQKDQARIIAWHEFGQMVDGDDRLSLFIWAYGQAYRGSDKEITDGINRCFRIDMIKTSGGKYVVLDTHVVGKFTYYANDMRKIMGNFTDDIIGVYETDIINKLKEKVDDLGKKAIDEIENVKVSSEKKEEFLLDGYFAEQTTKGRFSDYRMDISGSFITDSELQSQKIISVFKTNNRDKMKEIFDIINDKNMWEEKIGDNGIARGEKNKIVNIYLSFVFEDKGDVAYIGIGINPDNNKMYAECIWHKLGNGKIGKILTCNNKELYKIIMKKLLDIDIKDGWSISGYSDREDFICYSLKNSYSIDETILIKASIRNNDSESKTLSKKISGWLKMTSAVDSRYRDVVIELSEKERVLRQGHSLDLNMFEVDIERSDFKPGIYTVEGMIGDYAIEKFSVEIKEK